MPYSDVINLLRDARAAIDRASQILELTGPGEEPPVIPDNPGLPVVYGRNGYSDSSDPRAQNCRGYAVSDGKVMGVNLLVHTSPNQPYRVTNVTLVNEIVDQGQTVIRAQVLTREGNLSNANVRLAFPYDGEATNFANYITAGNDKNEFVMVNKYFPPGLGPLALMILDADNNIISDVVGSLGLPEGHHISVGVTFQGR